jgi:hypothetical protein
VLTVGWGGAMRLLTWLGFTADGRLAAVDWAGLRVFDTRPAASR